MKTGPSLILLTLLFPLCGFVLSAQDVQEPRHAPDGGSRMTIANITIPPMTGAPFTATVKAEVTRRLEDGTTVTIKNHRTVARDSSGRIFQERRLLTADGDVHETSVTQLEFSDPATHEMYVCDPTGRTCTLRPYYAQSYVGSAPMQQAVPDGKGRTPSVNLGSAILNGLDTVGTRETAVVDPVISGGNRPISVTKEFWYSQQLGINILTKRFDPRFGTQIFEVTDVLLGEPDANYFELPPGATILWTTPQTPSR
jgi:hypothetical protein